MVQGNVIVTNRDFRKIVFKKKTVILDSYIKEDLVHGNFYGRNRLVTHSTCTIRRVTRSTRLTTLSTLSIPLPTHSTGLSTRGICLSTRSTHLSIRSTHLPTRNICVSTCSTRSTICRSFDVCYSVCE